MRLTLDDFDTLCCPHCGETTTHHDRVCVHSAKQEDGDGIEVNVVNDVASVMHCPRKDFVARRDDVRVGLWCELCHGRFSIVLVQHKGQTTIRVEA